jgi:hypothetical protein
MKLEPGMAVAEADKNNVNITLNGEFSEEEQAFLGYALETFKDWPGCSVVEIRIHTSRLQSVKATEPSAVESYHKQPRFEA